jgi:hypothetical protein
VADISSPRWLIFERPVGACWQYQPRKDRMSEEKNSAAQILPRELRSQWFLTEPCCLATRAASWCCPARQRAVRRLVPSARTTVLHSNKGSSSAIWFDAHGTMPAFSLRTNEGSPVPALGVLY